MKDTMTHNIYNTPVPHNTDSDESDDEEMSPMGSFWPAPEDEEWKMVERSHGSLRGIDSDRLHESSIQECVVDSWTILRKWIIAVQDRRCC